MSSDFKERSTYFASLDAPLFVIPNVSVIEGSAVCLRLETFLSYVRSAIKKTTSRNHMDLFGLFNLIPVK